MTKDKMNFRTGIGYDVHKLVKGRKLMLGGVQIPYKRGLLGHSDADVVLHAICDAILGAAGREDIGEYFPDTDEKYKNVSSLILLKKVYELISGDGYKIVNLDAVILAQEPKLGPYKLKMKSRIALELGIDESLVNIKATTNEGLGFVGRKQGIACYAVVLLIKS